MTTITRANSKVTKKHKEKWEDEYNEEEAIREEFASTGDYVGWMGAVLDGLVKDTTAKRSK